MGLGDLYDNVMSVRDRNKRIYLAKAKLLQRLTMAQLQELYEKYCYIEPTPLKKEGEITAADILKMATKPGQPDTRPKYIDKITEQMSWDSLKMWAVDNKIKIEDIVV